MRYFGDWPNVQLYTGSGAYHGCDIHSIFGASKDVTGLSPSQAQMRITRLMQKAVAAFSKDPSNGLNRVLSWPQYDENKKSMILVAIDNEPEARLVFPRVYDAICNNITILT